MRLRLRSARKWGRIVLLVGLALVAYVGVCAYLVYSDPGGDPPVGALNRARNGVWMAHRWFDDTGRKPVEERELREMAERFRRVGIRDLYIHVGPMDAKGVIPPWDRSRWDRTRDAFRKRHPDGRLFAYLGAINRAYWGVAPDTLDLSDPVARKRIVEVSAELVKAGFDGIHFDVEPIESGDTGFLALLRDTRAGLPKGAPISVATPHLIPPGVPHIPPFTRLWTTDYYYEVGQLSDQIAHMGYDSMQPTAWMYKRFMRWQVRTMAKVVPCELLIGVPTYEEDRLTHRDHVENLQTALEGVRMAATGSRPDGIAIYAEWTTSAEEWSQLERAMTEGGTGR